MCDTRFRSFRKVANFVACAVPARIVLNVGKSPVQAVAPQVSPGLKVHLVLYWVAVRVQPPRVELFGQEVGPGAKHDVRNQVVMGDRIAMTGVVGRPSPARLVSRLIEVVTGRGENVRSRQVGNAGTVIDPFRRAHMLLRPPAQLRVDRVPHRDFGDSQRVLQSSCDLDVPLVERQCIGVLSTRKRPIMRQSRGVQALEDLRGVHRHNRSLCQTNKEAPLRRGRLLHEQPDKPTASVKHYTRIWLTR